MYTIRLPIMRVVRPALPFFNLCLLAFAAIACSSCTVKTGARTGPFITKVNPYHFQPGVALTSAQEKMIDFEYRRKTRGLVTTEDYYERYGNYYTVFWQTPRRDLPVTIRLEFRQATTGPKIFALEKECPHPRRTNTTEFEIIGDDYAERGAVTQWKASVVQQGSIVDEFKSFLWQ